MEAPIDVLVFGELAEGLAVSLLFFHPATDDLLRCDLSEDGFPLLDFEVGHAVGVSKAGECVLWGRSP